MDFVEKNDLNAFVHSSTSKQQSLSLQAVFFVTKNGGDEKGIFPSNLFKSSY